MHCSRVGRGHIDELLHCQRHEQLVVWLATTAAALVVLTASFGGVPLKAAAASTAALGATAPTAAPLAALSICLSLALSLDNSVSQPGPLFFSVGKGLVDLQRWWKHKLGQAGRGS